MLDGREGYVLQVYTMAGRGKDREGGEGFWKAGKDMCYMCIRGQEGGREGQGGGGCLKAGKEMCYKCIRGQKGGR